MLTSLHLQNFKGFKDTLIPELRKVNLILGGQNVGKTSLLEAVVFVAGEVYNTNTAAALSFLPQIFRPCEGHDAGRFWRGLVGTEKTPIDISVTAIIDSKLYALGGYRAEFGPKITGSPLAFEEVDFEKLHANSLALHIDGLGTVSWASCSTGLLRPAGAEIPHPFPVYSKKAAEQVELYGRLVTGKKKKEIIRLLKKIEPRLDSVDAVAPDGEHRVYVELSDGDTLQPLSQLGHGFTRLFELYAGLAVTDSKLALIDEIENGIHYSALPTLFQGIRELSEANGVQSIITTHSAECIKSAYEVFQDKLEDFQLIRLERTDDGNVRAVVIADENLKTVMEAGWEIR